MNWQPLEKQVVYGMKITSQPFMKNPFKTLLLTLFLCLSYQANSCTPYGVPTVVANVVGSDILLNVTSNTTWGCTYSYEVEIVCATGAYTGVATFPAPASGNVTGGAYPQMTIDISGYCPGDYKLRVREKVNTYGGGGPWSPYSADFFFTVPGASLTVSASASPTSICFPGNSTLTATPSNACGTINYTWDNGGGAGQIVNVSPAGTTTYTVTATDAASCMTVTDQVTVTAAPAAVAGTASLAPTSICDGETTTLTLVGETGTIQWQSGPSGAGPFNDIPGATTNAYVVGPMSPGDDSYFQAVITSCGNATTNVINVTVNTLPVIDAGVDQIFCDDGTMVTVNGSGGVSYVWTGGITDGVAFASPIGTTTYTVTGTDANNCTGTDDLDVTINALPVIDAGVDQTLCDDGTMVTLTGAGGVSYAWTGGITDATAFSPIIGTTTYTVTGTDANTCVSTDDVDVTVNPLDDPTFTYPQASYCSSEADPSATITGNGGGNFTAAPAGIVINAATGLIDLDASTPNTYDITYTTPGVCPQTLIVSVSIAATPSVNPIADQTVCEGANFADIIFTGSAGSVYDWTNDDVTIGLAASGSGDILAFAGAGTVMAGPSVSGNITVTPSAGTCVGTPESFILTVDALEDPSFSFSQALYCQSEADPSGLITGTPGGTFSSTAGLNINGATGLIDLPGSTAGIYDVTYTTPGVCSQSQDVQVEVSPIPDANAILDQTVCDGINFTDINYSGSIAGTTFGWTNDNTNIGLAANGIGDITGFTGTAPAVVEVANITITPSTASCLGPTSTYVLTVNPLDDPSFDYVAGLTYCQTGTNPAGNITGMTGGTFSYVATGGGPTLSINTATGDIDLALSDLGTYDITYNTTGAGSSLCPQQSTLTLSITDAPVADFILDIYCANDADPLPTFVGTGSGGTFTSAPAGLSINAGTGLVDLDASTPGTYTVTNTIDVAGCAIATFDEDITVNELPVATISGNQTVCPGAAFSDVVVDITAGVANWDLTYNLDGAAVNALGITSSPFSITGAVGVYDLVSITDGNGCTNTIVGTVTQDEFITPVMDALVDQSVCEGTNLSVQGFSTTPAGSTFSWDNLTGTDAGFGLSGIGNIGIFSGLNGTGSNLPVTVQVTPTSADGCSGLPADFVITINPTPTVSFTASPVSGCEPLLVDFTNTTIPGGADCTWSFGDGNVGTGCTQVSNTYMAGLYDVSLDVISNEGCAGSVTYTDYINVTPMPVAAFGYNPQTITVDDTEVQFSNSSLFADNYSWGFGDESAMANSEEPTHIYPQVSGAYTVELIASNNGGLCADTAEVIINIQDIILFYVPNVFTPDGDNFNEEFKPEFTAGYDPYDYHLMIFNRYGELVFESYNAAVGWDGTYSDRGLVEDGVYVWKIEFKETMSDKRHKHNGHVTVLK